MRNLKKILALVLAMIMSLSLMATAGATDFKDDENISDTYRQAAQVLSELGVFNGDQNGQFNPEKPITRAEVAAILYRIATGDIGLEGHKTYAPYNQFPDVQAEDWFAGYVTYCANAGYIKGRNTGKFDAKDNVTGYEVLAMILRAVGYDKNNEFVGSNWQKNSASIATQLGVLKNVLEDPNVKLSEPATREVVAELLFRASLLPQVTWNAATLSYREDGETLAKKNLNMEQVEGVVVANQWADLRNSYIATDSTVLQTADGERTLAVATDLTDIGESRYAYVQGSKVLGQLEDTGKNVVKDCAGLDPAGKATSVGALAGSLNTRDAEYFINFDYGTKDTSDYRIEYSVSFRNDSAKEWFESKYLGQGANNPVDLAALAAADNEEYDRTIVNELKDTGAGSYYQNDDGTLVSGGSLLGRTFSRVIPAGEKISALDVAIMKGIFGSAASFDSAHEDFSQLSNDIIHTGYVYAGTKSNPNTADRKDDLSDDYTYEKFAEEYIGTDSDTSFSSVSNGVWLKVVDNNNDGKAEYVFATVYDLEEVVDFNDRTGVYAFSSNDSTYAVCRDEYEFAVGDMILTAWIDGQLVVREADSEVLIIDKYSWKDDSVTTRDGEVKYESGVDIDNMTGYADRISDMQYGVEYEVFYDYYGFIRAYRPVNSDRNYGLLTDLYLNDYNNTHYIRNQIATVELSFVEEDGKLNMKEYQVANHDGKDVINPFVGVTQAIPGVVNQFDNLQRALAHLGLTSPDGRTVNARNNQYVGSDLGFEFDYDGVPSQGQDQSDVAADGTNTSIPNYNSITTDTNIQFSQTNVARYTLNEDGTVTLNTAAEYAYDKAGVQLFYWKDDASHAWGGTEPVGNRGVGGTRMTWADWRAAWAKSNGLTDNAANKAVIDAAMSACMVPVYAVDYVMLDTTNNGAATIGSGTYRFKIDDSYNDTNNLYNWHVNAVNDTVFYVVTSAGVLPFVGYKNLPTINTADITAMYAVAQNVIQDNSRTDYWVADVVVIEVPNLATAYGHMIYNVYDNYRQNQRGVIHELDVIDCQTGEVTTAVVDSAWTTPIPTGFYLLQNAEVAEDGTITAKGLISVESHKTQNGSAYANYGIYAGEVVRSNAITNRDSYIEVFNETTDVNVNGDEIRVPLNGAPWYSIHGYYTDKTNPVGRFTATQLSDRDYSGIQPNGDEVIYVTYGGKVIFVIDTSFAAGYRNDVPDYLNDYDANPVTGGVYDVALTEQTGPAAGDGTIKFTVNFDEYFDGTDIKKFPKPADIDAFSTTTDATGKTTTTISLAAWLAADGNLADYDLTEVTSADPSKYTVVFDGTDSITVTAVGKYDLREGMTLNLIFDYDEVGGTTPPIKANAEDNGFGVPASDWNIVGMNQSSKESSKRAADTTDPKPGDMVDLYFTVKDSYEVESVTINAPATIAGVYNTTMEIGKVSADGTANPSGTFVKYFITFQLPAGVVDLTINVANDDLNISAPANTTVAVGAGTDVVKDAALDGKKITIAADANYDLPTSVTVKVGTRTLTPTTDYTYAAGVITFNATAGNADGPIVIEGTATKQTALLTISGTDVASVVVKQGETVVNPERGELKYTLDKGVQYTVTVTPVAKDGKIVTGVSGGNGATAFTKNEDGTYTANCTITADTTDAITVTYANLQETITISAANGATIESVKQGGQEITAQGGSYTVNTQTNVEIVVKAASGETFLTAPTASGLTATKNADGTYTLTGKVAANVTITDTYWVKQVTVNSQTVNLTVAADGASATGTVTITVETTSFSDSSGNGAGPWTAEVEVSGAQAGYTITISGTNFADGKLTLSEASQPQAAVTATLTVTVTPAP